MSFQIWSDDCIMVVWRHVDLAFDISECVMNCASRHALRALRQKGSSRCPDSSVRHDALKPEGILRVMMTVGTNQGEIITRAHNHCRDLYQDQTFPVVHKSGQGEGKVDSCQGGKERDLQFGVPSLDGLNRLYSVPVFAEFVCLGGTFEPSPMDMTSSAPLHLPTDSLRSFSHMVSRGPPVKAN